MGIEPTARYWRAADFEDQEGHQTLIASAPSMGVAQGPIKQGRAPARAGPQPGA